MEALLDRKAHAAPKETREAEINLSLASFPGMAHIEAASFALEAPAGAFADPVLGPLSCGHIQLVPQSFGRLDEETCSHLLETFPTTSFRLHANVRVLPETRFADLSGAAIHPDWFHRAATISRVLGADAYTAHSGRRSEATLEEVLDTARRLADLFDCPVGVEGQYPAAGDPWLVSTWSEYRQLFESGVPYALDLSHLNIVARSRHTPSGEPSGLERTLVAEMLSCDRCIEVHVSDNDGSGDQHQMCGLGRDEPWWIDLLPYAHPDAVIFSEGNLLRQMRRGGHE